MTTRDARLTERIGYAENWLGRARQRIEEGEVTHGTLALLLAEAELHRAREVDLPPSAGPAVRPWAAWAAVGALTLAAAVVVITLMLPHGWAPPDAGQHLAPAVVRLSAGTGQMLHLVTVPEPPVERTVVQSQIVRVRVPVPVEIRRESPPAVAAPAPPAPVHAPPPARPVPAAPVAAPPAVSSPVPVPAPAAVLSEAEVIDMVLAAERTLRQTGR
jgi:hypothetical protein